MTCTIWILMTCLLFSTVLNGSGGQISQSAGTAPQPTYKVLYSFNGGTDGGYPNVGGSDAVLVQDWQGNLYGTASIGGAISANCPSGCGVVFKLDPSGKETVLHAFGGVPDGGNPIAGLTMDIEGNLYGTTVFGGTASLPAGTVFEIDRSGRYRVLYSFGGPDGNSPYGSLTLDIWGNLYGTTAAGGEFCATTGGCGVVFQIAPNGKEKILHSFSGQDGQNPASNLILDDVGNLFGTTIYGGSSGAGVIFKIDPRGNEQVIYNFTNGADGGTPGDLIRDPFGNLYGVTASGGYFGGDFCSLIGGCGLIYKVDRSDKFSVFHTFLGGADGSTPYGRLLLNSGNLYGTTFFADGFDAAGSIFKIDATGQETVLYLFTGGSDGGNPYAGLTVDYAGNLYGTAGYFGSGSSANCAGCGVVFELQSPDGKCGSPLPPLPPRRHSYQKHSSLGTGVWVAKP